tara:strand:+ start:3169 stop:4542 length:1374 start_codon:yes stop_codon:yes gene_type:complete
MATTLQTRFDNYVVIYNAFLSSLRETFSEIIIQKNTLKYKIVSENTSVPEYYFNIVCYHPSENGNIRIDLPEKDVNDNDISNGKLMILSNFTQNATLEVYYKNNIVVNVLNYNRFINPFYAIAFTGGEWKNISTKDEFIFEINDEGEPVINAEIDVNVKAEINLAQIAALSQLSSNEIRTKKYIRFADLTYDPEVYELNNNEGFLYIKDGALKFKDASNREYNLSFPGFKDPHLLVPQSQYKLENELDSIDGKNITDLLEFKNIISQNNLTQFTDGVSGQAALVSSDNWIYLYEGVSLTNNHAWSFWLKPSEAISSLPDNEQDCIFSYGGNNNHYRMFVTLDQRLYFAVKINGANIGLSEALIDYDFNTNRWHHFIVTFDSNNGGDAIISVYINGNIIKTYQNSNFNNLVDKTSDIDNSYIGKQGNIFVDEIKHFNQTPNDTSAKLEYDTYRYEQDQ